MVVNMLKAVLKMLEKPSKTRVECAKAVLQQVIEHLEKQPEPRRGSDVIHQDPPDPDDDLSPEARAAKDELNS